jgi:hypothetical protein
MRSVLAVVAGFFFILVSTTAIDVVLHAVHVFPPWGDPNPDGVLVLATTYRVFCSIAGCAIAARLAPRNPVQHALALGVLGLVLGVVATISTWNAGPAFANHWYPITLAAISIPCGWMGGRLHAGLAAAKARA